MAQPTPTAPLPPIGYFSQAGHGNSVNEDRLAVPHDVDLELRQRYGLLYLLADGMGGHLSGEVASTLAVNTVMDSYYRQVGEQRGAALLAAVQAANAAIHARGQTPDTRGMGSTLVAALLLDTQLLVAHVGDSRAYLVRQGTAQALTRDHSWLGEVLADVDLDPEALKAHPYRHVLTRALGIEPSVEADLDTVALASGDLIVLTSDGVTDVCEAEDIAGAVTGVSPQAGAEALGALAQTRGSPDDLSVLVIAPGYDTGNAASADQPRSVMDRLRDALGAGLALMTLTQAVGISLKRGAS